MAHVFSSRTIPSLPREAALLDKITAPAPPEITFRPGLKNSSASQFADPRAPLPRPRTRATEKRVESASAQHESQHQHTPNTHVFAQNTAFPHQAAA